MTAGVRVSFLCHRPNILHEKIDLSKIYSFVFKGKIKE